MLDKLESDLRAALLARDKIKVETLKGLKNALQYEAVSLSLKPDGLSEEQILKVFAREAKKRGEAAAVYAGAGVKDRAEAEAAEKSLIETYLPKQVDEATIQAAVNEEIKKLGSPSMQDMGKIMTAVRAKLGAAADGGAIAKLVKEALTK